MASIFENNDRRVIPNFRTLNKTIRLGELDSFQVKDIVFVKGGLEDYIDDFIKNPELPFAGDLLSAALVNNELENPFVKQAAEFILRNTITSTKSQVRLAKRILGSEVSTKRLKIDKIDEFLEENTKDVIYERIKRFKSLSQQSIPNPFIFSELARLYLIIGQRVKAYRCIQTALGLAPGNRYILRSFSRLMAHLGDMEYAHDVLRKSPLTKVDPWLLASEIAFASLRERKSVNVKKGIDILNSKNFSPFSISELASAIGTVEMLEGSRKKSKFFFEKALIKPNDNSLAQVEWANNKDKLFDLNLKEFNISNDYEAKALDTFHNKDWKRSMEYTESWFIDMPFARRPAEFGNHISAVYLEDHESAIKFCKAGLVSNSKDPLLLNNIAYSYALLDKPDMALEQLNKIDIEHLKEIKHRICVKATTGLIKYRKGEVEEGRRLYLEAIEEAKDNDLEHYNWLAIINMANEEFRLQSENTKDLIDILKRIPDKDEEISMLKERALNRNK